MFSRIGMLALAVCLSLAFTSSVMAAGGKTTELTDQTVYQIVDVKESDSLHISAGGGGTTVQDHNYQFTAKNAVNGQAKNIVVITGKESPIAKKILTMKPGDYFTASLDHRGTNPYDFAVTMTPYQLSPGEDRPGVFVFGGTEEKKKDTATITVVNLYKLGQTVSVTIPNVKDAAGKQVPDPKLIAAIEKVKNGESVEVVTQGSGAAMTLKSIEAYGVPQEAVFGKTGETEVEVGKTPSIEVTIGSSTVNVLVPGKAAAGTGKWVPDATLSAVIKTFKEGDKVIVRYRTDDNKYWLKEITKAPKAPADKDK